MRAEARSIHVARALGSVLPLALALVACGGASAEIASTSNVAPLSGQTGDGRVSLRRIWRPGEVLRSRLIVQTTAQVGGGPPVVVTSDSGSAQSVVEVTPDGTAFVEERQTAIRMRGADGQPVVDAQSDGMENVVFRYRVTPRGEIVGLVEAQGTTDANRQFVNGIVESIMQSATTFPEQAVAVGETWREERSIVRHTQIGEIRMVRRAVWTFRGVELRQGRRIAQLEVVFEIVAEPVQVPGGVVRAGGSGRGTVEHDIALGRPVTSTVTSDIVTNVAVAIGGEMTIRVQTEIQSTTVD